MTPFQRYIAEEIAEDHADGLVSRREALRRLGLLGFGAVAASGLLAAACGDDKSSNSQSSAPATSGAPPGVATAKSTQPITFAGPNGELQAAWAAADNLRGGVVIIHENRGLNDYIRSVAGRFAGVGYNALAVDLLSEEGGTASFADEALATAALAKVPAPRFVGDMKAAVAELGKRTAGKRLAAVGFCMGGGLVWQLLAAGEPRLAAAIPFYGPLPANPDFNASKSGPNGSAPAVLAFYGELDKRVTSTRDAAGAALSKAGLVHEIVVESGADHAFFNDAGPRYNPAAAADAWRRTTAWLATYVG